MKENLSANIQIRFVSVARLPRQIRTPTSDYLCRRRALTNIVPNGIFSSSQPSCDVHIDKQQRTIARALRPEELDGRDRNE
jgi:hypothetical protein